MSEHKPCPKCGMVMDEQRSIGILLFEEPVLLYRKGKSKAESIAPFFCPRCGYIELYKKTRKGKGKP